MTSRKKSDRDPQLVRIRSATQADGRNILLLVDALADYEKLPRPDREARQRLLADCFKENPRISVLLAQIGAEIVGYAFFLETYSSFLALPTLYIEDIFVLPEHRRKKVGQKLFLALVDEAVRRGCGRMEWTVLNWNKPAIDFYRTLRARHMNEWHLYRLMRRDMEELLASHL